MKNAADVRARRIAVALLLFYAAIALAVTLHHEPWRDEAETWLVARDLPLSETLAWTRPAGTPMLWPALVMPFARLGAPYVAQSLLNWAIAVAATALLLFRSPFNTTTKALFVVSFYAVYEYAVIARTYALGILLLFVVVVLHPQRHARPIAYAIAIALLANANAHSVAPAFAMAAWFAFETLRKRDARAWLALFIMLAGLAAVALQFYTPGHAMPPNVVSAPYFGAFFEAITGAFFPGVDSMIATIVAMILLIAILASLRREALWLALISLGGLAAIFTFLWIGGYRHYGLVLMTLIAAMWLSSTQRRGAVLALNIALAFSIVMSVRFVYADLTKNFSGSREIANVLARYPDHEIAAHPPTKAEAVLPYLSRKEIWYAALGRSGSYLHWDREQRIAGATSADVAAKRAAEHFAGRKWLFLSSARLAHPEELALTLRYATHEPLIEPRDADRQPNDERYWLYESTR